MSVQELLTFLKEQGYKHTGKREKIIRTFLAERRKLTLLELCQLVRKDYPNLGLETINKNISIFGELGLLKQVEAEGELYYYLNDRRKH